MLGTLHLRDEHKTNIYRWRLLALPAPHFAGVLCGEVGRAGAGEPKVIKTQKTALDHQARVLHINDPHFNNPS